jgi:hypothetical protein
MECEDDQAERTNRAGATSGHRSAPPTTSDHELAIKNGRSQGLSLESKELNISVSTHAILRLSSEKCDKEKKKPFRNNCLFMDKQVATINSSPEK